MRGKGAFALRGKGFFWFELLVLMQRQNHFVLAVDTFSYLVDSRVVPMILQPFPQRRFKRTKFNGHPFCKRITNRRSKFQQRFASLAVGFT